MKKIGRPKGSKDGIRIKTTCTHCGVEKETSSSLRKFCCHFCFTENRKLKYTLLKKCAYCKQEFSQRSPSGAVNRKKIYCNNSCAQKGKPRKKGYSLSEEHKRKIGEAQKGCKANNWQGGIYKEIDAQRRRSDYKNWRKQVFERDNYTCTICGIRGGELNVDHIKSFALYPELRTDTNNGRTLCVACHKKTPSYARNLKYQ
jgi:hypothetical protein